MKPKTVNFSFNLCDFSYQSHPILLSKSAQTKYGARLLDGLCNLIWANRFLLQSDAFELVRLRYQEGIFVIRRNKIGSFDYTFDGQIYI